MDNPVTELLKKALANFGSSGENWVQGTKAAFESPKCCIATALIAAYGEMGIRMDYRAGDILRNVTGHPLLGVWNDAPGRTFAEVKEVYLKAIAESEKGANNV